MRRAALLLLTATAALAGCPGEGGAGKGIERVDAAKLIRVFTADDAKDLDPHTTSDGGNVKIIVQLFQTLVRVDPQDTGLLRPELATSWRMAPDARSLVFEMRPGVTFHDGAALDAAAAKLSLDRMREVGFGLTQAPYKSEFEAVEAIEAQGMTLTLKLKRPVAPLMLRNLSMFCASIVSPKVLAAAQKISSPAEASAYVCANPMGTGPFQRESFTSDAKGARLKAFAGYWGGKPAVETLTFESVPDEHTRLERLLKTEGHVVLDEVPRRSWKQVGEQGRRLLNWTAANLCYLGINGLHPATKELALRQAIALAVDREKVLEHYEGTARPAFSLLSPALSAYYDPKLRCPEWSEDLAARRKLAAAKVVAAGAKGRALTIHYPNQPRPYLARPEQVADTLRQQLAAIGLDARIQGHDKSKLFGEIKNGQFELVLIGWTTDNGHPDNFYSPLADGAEGRPTENNTSRIVHAGVHERLIRAQGLADEAEARRLYQEIERLLQAEVCGYVPLASAENALAHSAGVEGLEVDLLGHYRFHRVTLK